LPPRYTRTHTRCRPGEVVFRLSAEGEKAKDDKAAKETVVPANGDRFVVTSRDGRLHVQKK
jgi:hypothetical protein